MNETTSTIPVTEPQNRTTGALILFLFFALPMPACLLIYHFGAWSMEQTAIASLSFSNFAWSGLIGLAIQALFMTGICTALWYITKDDRFKPVYAGWAGAAGVAFPALLLRLIGPNYDQIGSLAQLTLCIVAVLIVIRIRKNKLVWRTDNSGFGLIVAGIGVLPLAIYGSLGSSGDAFLSLLAGLAFGVLAASLMESTTGNVFLDGLGIGATLALLASAFGYDGSQLILLAVLPPFAFAIAVLMPARAASAAATGLLAFAGLAFFDPTELTIVLGDIGAVATKACGIVILAGLFTGAAALILRAVTGASEESETKRAVGWVGGAAMWALVILIFFFFGHPGNYGDRLFIIFQDQADLSKVVTIKDRDERLTTVYQELTQFANESQADLRKTFDKFHVEYTPYYLENAMEVRGGTLVRLYLLTRPNVERVLPSPRLRAVSPDEPSLGDLPAPDGSVQWNISMIGADKVWDEFGARGGGIVVGQSDSGVDGDHPAVHDRYRGVTQGNDYNWFDPWDGTTSPNDENGHGTHTLGTILGNNGIGVAPEAQWFGCVNLDRNLANPALYLDCMQFMLAPFPHGGDPFKDGDPTKAAHVLNNSWGCPTLEGCDPNALKVAADHLRDAGIFVVVSTGNDGPNCSTVEMPLALYDSVFSVGAINQFGNVADLSSRGPVTADGSGRMKPDIVAPGVEILSSTPKGTYAAFSGTSMAGPHVVGAVALLWSAAPELIGDIDATQKLLIDTAQPYTGDTSIGCFTKGTPNAAYGYGIVDVYAAVKEALGK
jgi:subtilisin family serine protease